MASAMDRISGADRLDALAALFKGRGFETVDPPVLQPLAPFLELSGEDVRRRMFLTADPTGREFCLRPDFTIPVALEHIERGGGDGRFSYLGPVFRHRSGGAAEFLQAGVEWFGDDDAAGADAAIVALAVEAVGLAGVTDPAIRIGDVSLAAAVLDALGLPGIWRRRLWRQQGRTETLAEAFARADAAPAADTTAYPALAALLESGDADKAAAAVEDLMALTGVEPVGGRSAHDIAARFVEKAMLAAGDGLSAEHRRVLTDFEAIDRPVAEALDAVDALAGGAGLDIAAPLERCRTRAAALESAGLDLSDVRFDCGFIRPLDYYTGLVFDIHAPDDAEGGKLTGGGRYDALMGYLNGGQSVPAVGFSLWVDRVFPEAGAGR